MAKVPPSFLASGTTVSSAQYSTRHIAPPFPAGVAVDDICVIWASCSDNTLTTPAGWTLQLATAVPSTYVWTRVYDGTEGASVTLTMGGNATRLRIGVMHAFRGGDPVDPIDGVSGDAFSAVTSHTPPSVTTAVDDTSILTLFSTTRPDSSGIPSLPSGAASIYTASTASGTDTATRHFTKGAATAGVIAGSSSSWSGSDSGSVVSIGLKAVDPPPPVELGATIVGNVSLLARLTVPTPDFDSFLDSRVGRGTLVKVDVGDYDGSKLIRLEGGKS